MGGMNRKTGILLIIFMVMAISGFVMAPILSNSKAITSTTGTNFQYTCTNADAGKPAVIIVEAWDSASCERLAEVDLIASIRIDSIIVSDQHKTDTDIGGDCFYDDHNTAHASVVIRHSVSSLVEGMHIEVFASLIKGAGCKIWIESVSQSLDYNVEMFWVCGFVGVVGMLCTLINSYAPKRVN